MKAILIAASLALSGCGAVQSAVATTAGLPPTPVAAADKTVLDEKAAIAVETAYKAARVAIEAAADAGIIHGTTATKAAALDNRAFAAVQAVRTAYRAGNAASYGSALTEARSAIASFLAVVKG